MNTKTRSLSFRRFRLSRVRKRHRKGAQVIEFAIILPLFLLLTFGILEFGRAMMVVEIITNASREGARKAAVSGSTQAQVYTTIDDYLNGSNITGFTRSVSPNPGTAARGTAVTVTVSVPYASVAWAPVFFLHGKTLNATATMRKE